MTVLKHALRLHKWIALLIGLQIFLWILGGVVMSAIPIEVVRSEHKMAHNVSSAIDPDDILSLSKITNGDTVDQAELISVLGKPAWRIHKDHKASTFDAINGRALSPVSQSLARNIAAFDYSGSGNITSVKLLDNPPSEYGRDGPVWQVIINRSHRIYIDPDTTRVTARRSNIWRFYDFFWRLHVMDYDDGENFNHPLLIAAALIALLVVLSGFTLLYIRIKRLIHVRRYSSAK